MAYYQGVAIGVNFNKIIDVDSHNSLLVAGFGVTANHSTGIPIFQYLSYAITHYAGRKASDSGKRLWGANMSCDGQSLEYFTEMTPGSSYPFDGNIISYKDRALYAKILKLSFDRYVFPSFPNATLCTNTHIVNSDKKEIGFHDSFYNSKPGSDSKYTSFIKNWIDDYETQDILFIGIVPPQVIKKIEKALKY